MEDKGARRRVAHYKRTEKIKAILKNNLLTFIIVLAVVLGVITGIIIRAVTKAAISDTTAKYLGFPGDVLIRMLKFIATPLIVTCIICALGSMNLLVSKTICWQIIVLLFATKIICVAIAMLLTAVIRPGRSGNDQKSESNSTVLQPSTIPDIFLDMLRNIVPENLVSVYIRQYKTRITRPDEYTDNYILWPFVPSYDYSINLLGAICLAIVFGLCLTIMKVKAQGLLNLTRAMYEVSMKVTTWILWTAPPFLFFLVMTEIIKIGDISLYFSTWGLYVATVLISDLVVCIVVDPILLFIFTRSNPFRFYADMLSAYFTALGTASSLGTMPVLIECLLKHGVDERLVRFVIPIIVNINKDGAAVYLGVAAVFAAQLLDASLGLGQYAGIFILATMGSIAAAGVPFSGPVILLMILNALGLDQSLIGTFLAVDWITDRGSTIASIVSNSILAKALEKWNQRLLNDLP